MTTFKEVAERIRLQLGREDFPARGSAEYEKLLTELEVTHPSYAKLLLDAEKRESEDKQASEEGFPKEEEFEPPEGWEELTEEKVTPAVRLRLMSQQFSRWLFWRRNTAGQWVFNKSRTHVLLGLTLFLGFSLYALWFYTHPVEGSGALIHASDRRTSEAQQLEVQQSTLQKDAEQIEEIPKASDTTEAVPVAELSDAALSTTESRSTEPFASTHSLAGPPPPPPPVFMQSAPQRIHAFESEPNDSTYFSEPKKLPVKSTLVRPESANSFPSTDFGGAGVNEAAGGSAELFGAEENQQSMENNSSPTPAVMYLRKVESSESNSSEKKNTPTAAVFYLKESEKGSREDAEQAVLYTKSNGAANTGASNSVPTLSTAPVQPGQLIKAKLITSIETFTGRPVPVIAESAEGNWVGMATLSPGLGRLEVEFTRLIGSGQSYEVHGLAYDPGYTLGLPAQLRDMSPTLAQDLVRSGLSSLKTYAQSLLSSGTTTLSNGTAVTTQNAAPLGAILAGELGKVFELPKDNQSFLRVARIERGSEFMIALGLTEGRR